MIEQPTCCIVGLLPCRYAALGIALRLVAAGTLLVIVGVMMFELGALDMHVSRKFEVENENIMGDLAFHEAGPVVTKIGGLVLLYGAAGRRTTSRRSSRSTVTSARPSSSAVTLSSSPPITT